MLDSRHLRVIWFLIVFLSLMKSVYSEEANNSKSDSAAGGGAGAGAAGAGPAGANYLYSVIGKMHGEAASSVAGSTHMLDFILDRVETKLGNSGPGPTGPTGPEDFRIVAPTPVSYGDEHHNNNNNNNYERYPPYPSGPAGGAGPSGAGYGQSTQGPDPSQIGGHGGGHGHHGQQDSWIPPLSKDELMALYQAAIHKGTSINLNNLPPLGITNLGPTGPGGPGGPTGPGGDAPYQNQNYNNGANNLNNNAPNYQQNEVNYNQGNQIGQQHQQQQQQQQIRPQPTEFGTVPGYQYFFYPISSFMPNGGNGQDQGQMSEDQNNMMLMMLGHKHGLKKKVEPLFLAVAGFVGVAMVFTFAVLFLPKISNLAHFHDKFKPHLGFKKNPHEFSKLSKLVIESIEGKDCTERLTCEVGRAFRSMNVGDDSIRMMEVMLPPSMARPLAKLRKSYIKREKCHYIPCRNKNSITKKNDFSKFQQFKPKPKVQPKTQPPERNKFKSNKH